MPNAREFARQVAQLTMFSEADLLARARYLREAGLLPQGGHGLNAPNIRPVDAARFLLSMVPLKAVDAAMEVPLLASMQPTARPFLGCDTFLEVLTMQLSLHQPDDDFTQVDLIEISRETHYAIVRTSNPDFAGKPERGTMREWIYRRPGAKRPGVIFDSLNIRRNALTQLVGDLGDVVYIPGD